MLGSRRNKLYASSRGKIEDASIITKHINTYVLFLFVHVDHIIFIDSSNTLLDDLLTSLTCEFAMKDLGPLYYFLEIETYSMQDDLVLIQSN